MHQTAVSTGERTNGADLGIREDWLPLFDRFGVDLVVCGHEHHYERTPSRFAGTLPTDTLTPNPVESCTGHMDTSKGTVHLVIGGGGTSIPSNKMFFPEPRCQVLMSRRGSSTPPPVKTHSAVHPGTGAVVGVSRPRQPCGFVAFDVDPGQPGGTTSMAATYYAVHGPFGETTAVDKFTLTRPARC